METLEHASDALIGQVLDDRYQIVGALGQGGMGTVYCAEVLTNEMDVAVKVVRPELASNATVRERFLREAIHTAQIESPFVVKTYDSGVTADGRPYLVMERLRGASLIERLRDGPSLSLMEAAKVGRDVARALAAAHRAGVVHRDLKPDNVFLCDDGSVKVLDFGIAKAFVTGAQKKPQRSLTEAHRVVGTPAYMSPEVITKEGLGPGSDLYSLGVILFELMVGEPPFYETDAVATMYRHLHEPPRRLSDVQPDLHLPGELQALVAELLEKSPEKRPGDAALVADRIDHMLPLLDAEAPAPVRVSDQFTTMKDVHLQPPAAERPRWKRGLWTGLAVGGVVLLALVAGYWRFAP